jgi:hypothetical protein
MAVNKTKPTAASPAAFINGLTESTRRSDAKAIVKLMKSATGEKPKMWGPSIVGFGTYHYKHDSGREGDMPLVGFSPRKPATVFYGLIGSQNLILFASESGLSRTVLFEPDPLTYALSAPFRSAAPMTIPEAMRSKWAGTNMPMTRYSRTELAIGISDTIAIAERESAKGRHARKTNNSAKLSTVVEFDSHSTLKSAASVPAKFDRAIPARADAS